MATYILEIETTSETSVDVNVWVASNRKGNKIPFYQTKLSSIVKCDMDELIKYGVGEIVNDLGFKIVGDMFPSFSTTGVTMTAELEEKDKE
jgi:hypothetical protein